MLTVSAGLSASAAWTAGVTALCAIWWATEAIPLPATALIPIGVFPLVGVLDAEAVASAYGSQLILLFLGGFLLSKAMECSGAHRRIALQLVNWVGGSPRRLVFAFLLAAGALSMWVSNTATALMLLPVALATIERVEDRNLRVGVLLAVAYGSSIGGMGTPIGSPPNLVFLEVYRTTTGVAMSFVEYMTIALPAVILLLPLAALWLTRRVTSTEPVNLPETGRWAVDERRVMIIFALTALAWITRGDPFGGWSQWFGLHTANDASVALVAAVALFLVPNGRGGRLLDWESAASIPWGMLILFAGGIVIAKAFSASGLSTAIGDLLAGVGALPVVLLLLMICLGVTFLTEVNSNTATAVLLMPVLAAAALANELDPRLLMIPAALSATCAFMLPVATPPNAVVFGSGSIRVQTMIREGFALNLIGALVITTVCYLRLA